jgi:hypothetical protein
MTLLGINLVVAAPVFHLNNSCQHDERVRKESLAEYQKSQEYLAGSSNARAPSREPRIANPNRD